VLLWLVTLAVADSVPQPTRLLSIRAEPVHPIPVPVWVETPRCRLAMPWNFAFLRFVIATTRIFVLVGGDDDIGITEMQFKIGK